MTFSLVANITTWDEDSYGFRKTQFPQHVDGKPRILHRCRDEAEKILTPNLNGRQSFKANDQSGLLFLKSTPNSWIFGIHIESNNRHFLLWSLIKVWLYITFFGVTNTMRVKYSNLGGSYPILESSQSPSFIWLLGNAGGGYSMKCKHRLIHSRNLIQQLLDFLHNKNANEEFQFQLLAMYLFSETIPQTLNTPNSPHLSL